MRVALVTPAAPGSLSGNRVTAERWAGILRGRGHEVAILTSAGAEARAADPDLLVALHAHKSAEAIASFAARHPDRPLVVALTGTDLYGDLSTDEVARRSLRLATRLIALQARGLDELPPELKLKVHVIVQSAQAPEERPEPLAGCFEVVVSGHLREVKDPFRAAEASRLLPASSRIRITHLGAALEAGMEGRARAEMAANPRYHWLGGLSHREALAVAARARLLALTSVMEGGANVVCEALAAGVPVLSSAIPGSAGLLGDDYPGTFPVGDTAALAALLLRAETDPAFYADLAARCAALASEVEPAREREAWEDLLAALGPRRASAGTKP
jgi:putative glycosyltransferase (TIGR04348 family)